MHRTLTLLAAAGAGLIALSGCGVSEEDKAAELSSAWCSRYQECRAEAFSKNWDSMGQCENKETNRWLGKLDTLGDETQLACTIDEKALKTCTDALESMECDDFSSKAWEEDCSSVMLCAQGLSADW